jgi:hypothetical protein
LDLQLPVQSVPTQETVDGWFGFMVFNATFNNIQLYCGGQFYWLRKPEDPIIFCFSTVSLGAVVAVIIW